MKRLLVAFMAICLLLLAACPTGAQMAAKGEDMGEFVIGTSTPPSGALFTGMWGDNTSDMDIRSMIHGYGTMVWSAQPTFTPNPYVVLNLTDTYGDDGNKLYIVDIMEGLTYNDGTPITARDYVFSLLLMASPQIRDIGETAVSADYIAGYEAFAGGESDVFSGVRVFGDYTFGVEIKADHLPFFYEMSMLDITPYPIHVIAPGCEVADDGDGAYLRNADPSATEPLFTSDLLRQTILDPNTGYQTHPKVTSGPYTLTGFDGEKGEARFEINPLFIGNHEGRRPTIDNVVLVTLSQDSMISELQSGRVQLLNKVAASDAITQGMQLVSQGIASMQSYPRMGLGFLHFSCERGPTQFEAVRKALAYALDRDEYRTEYTGNFGQAVNGYYGMGQWMVRLINGERDQLAIGSGKEQAAWDALTLDALNPYAQDLEAAKRLLEDDGWTLNEAGDPFREGTDPLRYKDVGGALMGLNLKWAKAQDSAAADLLRSTLDAPLRELGMAVEIAEMPFADLMRQFYRQDERTFDLMVLGTNFNRVFDPSQVFNTADEYQGIQNTSGLRDAQLEELADALRSTEPGNDLEYCRKWLAFQQRWNETLPMLPLYSNLYFDFNSPDLYFYAIGSEVSWPEAILSAYYSTIPPMTGPSDDGLEADDSGDADDGEMIILD